MIFLLYSYEQMQTVSFALTLIDCNYTQDDKRKMVASAFGEDQTGGHGTRLTVDDIRFLFEGSKASRR